MPKSVLVMLSSPLADRMAGVARFARERDWRLMFQDRFGFAHPFDWAGDGVIATIRGEPRSLAFLRRARATRALRNGCAVGCDHSWSMKARIIGAT